MLSIAPGYDPKYLTRQVGRGCENYYLSATLEHGEPPGIWWGEGARALGLEPDSEVDGRIMEALYGDFLDPRDPAFLDPSVPDEEKARLGRRKQQFKSWKQIYAEKLAAEPEASPERREELRIEAKSQARQAVIHHDATFSPPKSVTLVHAGLLAAAQKAEAAGNADLAARYRQAADVVWDGVMAGADAALRYLQEHAGEARAGYHGAKIAGRTTGRWVPAGGWVVARFRQHTNREGDPQLHVHQAILNRQLCADGRWRALDGKAIYRARPAAAAHGERVMEEYLTRRLGLEFRSRADGQGREVVGVSPELIAEFSSRRAQVTADLEQRIADYIATHGRPPTPRVLFRLAQHATKATKAAKPKAAEAPTPEQRIREWEERTTAAELDALSQIPMQTLGRLNPTERPAPQLDQDDVTRVIEAAIADVQRDKATWTRYELTRAINRHLPDYLGALHPERVEALLEQLTDMALGSEAAGGVRLLNAPDEVNIPDELRREDGRSVYLAQAADRYTTVDQLDREADLLSRALRRGAPRLEFEQAVELIGISAEEAKRRSLAGEAVPEVDEPRPLQDQADALRGILTSGRAVDVLLGPAGTGKSFTVSRLARAWREATGAPVLGLATAQNAANVLKGEGLDDAWNIARWLGAVDAGETSLRPGQLVIVDEASMTSTSDLLQIQQLADAAGAKVVWTGDPGQLSAPEAGGAMRRRVEVGGAYRLTSVVRFREEWERQASIMLREGMREALIEYDQRGRLYDGTRDEMEAQALRGYLADYLQGKQTLLLTATNEQAAELAGRVRQELVALGKVDADGVPLRDGNVAGRGDLIMVRRNVELQDDLLELANRDVLTVAKVNDDGSVFARVVNRDGSLGTTVTLHPEYLRHHVQLGYAGTVHAAQGRTVDTCHGVVDASATRESLYVTLTRGREANLAYVVVDRDRASDLRPGPEQAVERTEALLRDATGAWSPKRTSLDGEAGELDVEAGPLNKEATMLAGDRISVLSAVLEQEGASQTATEALIEEGERPRHLGHLGSILIDQTREHMADGYIARAVERGALAPSDAARLRSDEAKGMLGVLLYRIEMSGRDADRILDAAIAERELDTAESVAKTLHWRITQAGKARGIDVDQLEIGEEYIAASWSQRVKPTGAPRIDQFRADLAARMDLREAELGQEALHNPPQWLVQAIGEPPQDTDARQAWAQRAGKILGYREQFGHTAESDPIGPAPSRKAVPEQRAAWWAAYDALGRPDASREIAGATDGELWCIRAAYEREARWAPPHVGEELARVSREARERHAEAVRLQEAARHARDPEAAAAFAARARGQEALAEAARKRQGILTRIHEARRAWWETTKDLALRAMRADAELRRREHVAADRLPPLHIDTDDARERIARQRAAEAVAEVDRYGINDGQLELPLGPQVERVAAWELRQSWREQVMAELDQRDREEMEWRWLRRKWARGELDELPQDPRRGTATSRVLPVLELDEGGDRARLDEVAPEAEPADDVDRYGISDGQLMLDVFGSGVDRDIDVDLADAADKAQAAAAIAAARQAQREAEAAEVEERVRQAEREDAERAVIERRERERVETERAKLEARHRVEREAAAAAELVSASFPYSPSEVRMARDRGHTLQPPAPPSQRDIDRGDGLGR